MSDRVLAVPHAPPCTPSLATATWRACTVFGPGALTCRKHRTGLDPMTQSMRVCGRVAAGVMTPGPRGRMSVSSGQHRGRCPAAYVAAGRTLTWLPSLFPMSLLLTPSPRTVHTTAPHATLHQPTPAAGTGPPRCLQATQPHRRQGLWGEGGPGTGKVTQGCRSRCSRRRAILKPHPDGPRPTERTGIDRRQVPSPLTYHRTEVPGPGDEDQSPSDQTGGHLTGSHGSCPGVYRQELGYVGLLTAQGHVLSPQGDLRTLQPHYDKC